MRNTLHCFGSAPRGLLGLQANCPRVLAGGEEISGRLQPAPRAAEGWAASRAVFLGPVSFFIVPADFQERELCAVWAVGCCPSAVGLYTKGPVLSGVPQGAGVCFSASPRALIEAVVPAACGCSGYEK